MPTHDEDIRAREAAAAEMSDVDLIAKVEDLFQTMTTAALGSGDFGHEQVFMRELRRRFDRYVAGQPRLSLAGLREPQH